MLFRLLSFGLSEEDITLYKDEYIEDEINLMSQCSHLIEIADIERVNDGITTLWKSIKK